MEASHSRFEAFCVGGELVIAYGQGGEFKDPRRIRLRGIGDAGVHVLDGDLDTWHDAARLVVHRSDHRARRQLSLSGNSTEQNARQKRAECGTIDGDRKSTRLNSSHSQISYAVFCLKKKKT